jgi:hypothetical protein
MADAEKKLDGLIQILNRKMPVCSPHIVPRCVVEERCLSPQQWADIVKIAAQQKICTLCGSNQYHGGIGETVFPPFTRVAPTHSTKEMIKVLNFRPLLQWKIDVFAKTMQLSAIQFACHACCMVTDIVTMIETATDPQTAAKVNPLFAHYLTMNGYDVNAFDFVQEAYTLAYAVQMLVNQIPSVQVLNVDDSVLTTDVDITGACVTTYSKPKSRMVQTSTMLVDAESDTSDSDSDDDAKVVDTSSSRRRSSKKRGAGRKKTPVKPAPSKKQETPAPAAGQTPGTGKRRRRRKKKQAAQ